MLVAAPLDLVGRGRRRRPRRAGSALLTRAFIGLGSNLGDREATIRAALDLLAADPGLELLGVSTLRDTAPVGVEEQPRFLNGVAELATELAPPEVLERLLAVERRLGRDRTEEQRFGPRTIDLDLLLYGDEMIDLPDLVVPHPRLHERRFVLGPLVELDAALVVPGRGPVSTLLAGLE